MTTHFASAQSDDPLRVLVVDDDPLARRGVLRLLERSGGTAVVGECANAQQAIVAAATIKPDAILLDIEMPDNDGFSVADAFPPGEAPYVIFVTAYDRYAVEAFRHQALDYVLKPPAPERLAEALERARGQRDAHRMLQWASRMQASGTGAATPSGPNYLAEVLVRIGTRDVLVRTADMDWIEADSYYARLHVGTREYLLREPLQSLEKRLDPQMFIRVHRSAILNVRRVREVRYERTGERAIVLSTGARVRVSRARWKWFAQHLRERTRVQPAGEHSAS